MPNFFFNLTTILRLICGAYYFKIVFDSICQL